MMVTVSLFIFPLLMLYAALSDIRSYTIPNRINVALVMAWPIAVILCGVPMAEAAWMIFLAFMSLCLCFGFFSAGWLGGGDAKMIAATALWVGPAAIVPFVYVTVIAGAVFGMVLFTFRRFPLPIFAMGIDWVNSLHGRRREMPYGVAIAFGGIFVWPLTAFFPF